MTAELDPLVAIGRPANARPCRFPRRDGSPCRSFATWPDAGCRSHSQTPEAIASRREQSTAGGRGRSTLHRAAKLLAVGPWAPIADQLVRAIEEVADGSLDPRRAEAIAQACRALVAVNDQAAIAARLELLEQQIATLGTSAAAETFLAPDGTPLEAIR
jgi:hypothetical protein